MQRGRVITFEAGQLAYLVCDQLTDCQCQFDFEKRYRGEGKQTPCSFWIEPSSVQNRWSVENKYVSVRVGQASKAAWVKIVW